MSVCLVSGNSELRTRTQVNSKPVRLAEAKQEKAAVKNKEKDAVTIWDKLPPLLRAMKRMSRLDPSPATNRWLETVRKHMMDANPHDNKLTEVLRGIVAAFKEYGISYKGRPFPEIDFHTFEENPRISNNLLPTELLKSRMGNCRDSSFLVAATLSQLGFRAVLIIADKHIVAGAVTNKSREGHLQGIPFKPRSDEGSQILYLYPIEANFFYHTSSYSFQKAFENGRETVKKILRIPGRSSVIMDTNGKVLWWIEPHEWEGGIILGGCDGDPEEYNIHPQFRRNRDLTNLIRNPNKPPLYCPGSLEQIKPF